MLWVMLGRIESGLLAPFKVQGIGVAALVRSMNEVEVRTLVDEVHASGFVQTLEDASQVLATVDEQAVRRGQ